MPHESRIAQRTGIIWTPNDIVDLFTVSIDGTCSDEEFQEMININKAARLFTDGCIDGDEYLDRLEYYGIKNPYEIAGEAIEHLELILDS